MWFAQRDTFVFNPNFGKDVVTDFNVVHDILAFSHTLFSSASQVLAKTQDTSAGAMITIDAQDTITLSGVTKQTLATNAPDFQFF